MIIFTSPVSQEEDVFLMQLVARGTVIFVHVFPTKYLLEAVLTAEKSSCGLKALQ